jgi:hypothetical protein
LRDFGHQFSVIFDTHRTVFGNHESPGTENSTCERSESQRDGIRPLNVVHRLAIGIHGMPS